MQLVLRSRRLRPDASRVVPGGPTFSKGLFGLDCFDAVFTARNRGSPQEVQRETTAADLRIRMSAGGLQICEAEVAGGSRR